MPANDAGVTVSDYVKALGVHVGREVPQAAWDGVVDRLLTPSELAARLGVPVPSLAQLRFNGNGPPYVKVGRLCRYRESDVAAWIASRTRTSTLKAR